MKTTGGNPIKSGLRETQTYGNEMWVNHWWNEWLAKQGSDKYHLQPTITFKIETNNSVLISFLVFLCTFVYINQFSTLYFSCIFI